MTILNLSTAQLRHIISIREQIENLQAELSSITGNETVVEEVAHGKRTISPSARARIAAAQRARWAKVRGSEAPAPATQKRKMSAAGRAKIAAAARARWAKAKAAGRNSL